MKIKLDFSDGSVSIPASAVKRVTRASETALRLLFILTSDAGVRENYDAEAERVTKLLKCSRAQLDAALAFWCGAGVADIENENNSDQPADRESSAVDVSADGQGAVQTKTAEVVDSSVIAAPDLPEKQKSAPDSVQGSTGDEQGAVTSATVRPTRPAGRGKLIRAAELPDYSTEALNSMLENDGDAVALVDEAQRRIGRMFNPREVSVLIGLKSYLELTDDYLYILLEHCARVGKTSMRYVETVAFGMYDEGVNTADALREQLAQREEYATCEGRFKAMVGARGRRLTAKESRFVNRWCIEMKCGFDMVELAYDITVDSCHEYNPAYMNGILERWYAAGITTPEAVKSDAEAHKKGKQDGASFDTDEFFEAALKRSYSDN